MGLDSADRVPRDIDFATAYAAIRTWYRENLAQLRQRAGSTEYAEASEALIRALPRAASDLEIKAVFGEVISGLLEWGYHLPDEQYKMAAYAHGALEFADQDYMLEQHELDALRMSPLWPLLTVGRQERGA